MKTRSAVISVALGIVALGLVVGGAGGEGATGRDFTLKPCSTPFNEYYLGPSFLSYQLTGSSRVCSAPEPLATDSANGGIDPESLGRPNYRNYLYGTCTPGNDFGCAPPVQVQTWPVCERSPADYSVGPEADQVLQPDSVSTIRGVPARFYESRVELIASDVLITIYGDGPSSTEAQIKELLKDAAERLRTTPSSPQQVTAAQLLPTPVAGAVDGTLPC